MRYRPYPGTRKEVDLLTGIAPVFRFDLKRNEARLIGTGFWVTALGHLVTAWHVVEENIGADGADRGPIFAIQALSDGGVVARNFVKSDRHPLFDLALSETAPALPNGDHPTSPIALSLDELSLGAPVFSFAVLSDAQTFTNDKPSGFNVYRFAAETYSDALSAEVSIRFAVRLSFGHVTAIFKKMRDRVMLPFPCVQTDVPIYGGNSGGPLLDVRGRVCAVHCSSFEGKDIAFHIPIQGVLQLQTRAQSLGIQAPAMRNRSILELAVTQTVLFEPPMLDADNLMRSALRWLWYAIKCLARRERPSTSIHLATARPAPRLSEPAA